MSLKLGVPSKGRLMEKTFEWFAARGIGLERTGSDREYAGRVTGEANVDLVLLSASEIPRELAAGRITRCWKGRTETITEIGGGPNGAAIGPDGALYICNNGGLDLVRFQNARGPGHEGRVERVDLHTGRVERLYDRSDGVARVRAGTSERRAVAGSGVARRRRRSGAVRQRASGVAGGVG